MLEQKVFLVFTRIAHIKLAWSLLWEDITESSKGITSVYKRRKKMLKTEFDKQLQDIKAEGISVAIWGTLSDAATHFNHQRSSLKTQFNQAPC